MSTEPTRGVDRRIADVLPRRSGEIVFDSPWEKHAFAMAVAMCQKGLVPFDEFRWRVVAAISTWERANQGQEERFHFYERWLLALERLLTDRGILSREEIERRASAIASDERGSAHS